MVHMASSHSQTLENAPNSWAIAHDTWQKRENRPRSIDTTKLCKAIGVERANYQNNHNPWKYLPRIATNSWPWVLERSVRIPKNSLLGSQNWQEKWFISYGHIGCLNSASKMSGARSFPGPRERLKSYNSRNVGKNMKTNHRQPDVSKLLEATKHKEGRLVVLERPKAMDQPLGTWEISDLGLQEVDRRRNPKKSSFSQSQNRLEICGHSQNLENT